MKRTLKILGSIATVLAIVALVTPASLAQCPGARSFGGFPGGKTGAQVIVDASSVENLGNELAQFWETPNPPGVPGGLANTTGVGAGGTCDSQGAGVGWWQFSDSTNTTRGIRGFVAQPGCTLPACPGVGSGMTFLIEDRTADGQGSAYIVYATDETPAGVRWYDHARTDPAAGSGTSLTHTMTAMPSVTVAGAGGTPPNTTTSNDYPDVGIAINAVAGAGNTPQPGSSVIASYDVMSFHGPSPPGSDRSLWTAVPAGSVPYNDAAIIADSVAVPCPDENSNTFLAIGITFVGGVQGSTVGPPSLPIACDPNVAEPDTPVRRQFTRRPAPAGRNR